MTMTRREQIERLLVGSVLTNGAYWRDLQCVRREDIEDLITRDIFDRLPDLVQRAGADRMPLDVLFDDNTLSAAVIVQATELAGTDDFDIKKVHYNLDALTDYYFGGATFKPTEVEFRDYVSQFLRMTYGTTERPRAGV